MQNINSKNKLNELHRILNRLDIHKDAYKSEEHIESENGKELFNYLSNDLFGNMNSYETTKILFEEKIIKYMNTIHNLPISSLFFKKKKISTINIPSDIKYIVYDTGVNPIILRPDLILLITPGTYMDPAPKLSDEFVKINKKYLEFDRKLNYNDFIELGIDSILIIKTVLQKNDYCKINIQLSNNDSVNVIFNNELKPIKGDKEYFDGNATKNAWFDYNKLDIKNIEILNESKKYILCKLIGDLLQAYYLKLIIDTNNSKNFCLITIDNNLRIRCILLNIPVIIKNHKNKMTEYLYQTTDNSILNGFQSMYLNMVKEHNEYNIEFINEILKNNHFKINDTLVILNDEIKSVLTEIKNTIEDANKQVDTINFKDFSDMNKYRKYILKYKSFFMFGKLNEEYILYTNNTTRLFPGSLSKDDYIYKMNKKIDDYIFSLIKFTGGSKFTKVLDTYFKNLIAPLDDLNDYNKYSKLVDTYIENDENSKGVQLCIYYNLLKFNKDKFILFNEIEVLYNYLILFYDYVGKVIVDDKFMTSIIKLYKENKLQNMSYEEFENLVKEWYKTIRDPNDDPFLGFIDDKDDENDVNRNEPNNINKANDNSNNHNKYQNRAQTKTRKRKFSIVQISKSTKYKNNTKKIKK
jgi:hypothetical protein